MDRIEITEDELVAALLEASSQVGDSNPHNAKTKNDLIELTGWGENRIYQKLHALKDDGRLGVTKIPRERLGGALQRVVAYYVKDAEK